MKKRIILTLVTFYFFIITYLHFNQALFGIYERSSLLDLFFRGRLNGLILVCLSGSLSVYYRHYYFALIYYTGLVAGSIIGRIISSREVVYHTMSGGMARIFIMVGAVVIGIIVEFIYIK